MRLYPLEGGVKSHAIEARREETVEKANLTEEFIASKVLNELCTKIIQDDTTTRSAKRANRDKSLYQFASRYLEEHQESHHLLRVLPSVRQSLYGRASRKPLTTPVNDLFYNDIMPFHHGWNEIEALDQIIAWYQKNVNPQHPKRECLAQIEFTHARAAIRFSSKCEVMIQSFVIFEENGGEQDAVQETIIHDPEKRRERLQSLSVRENRGEFSTEFSAFVSINDKAISAPSPTEARLIKDIDDGSLHVRISFRLPERDYNTIDISRWAHGIGVDQTRLCQKSIFIKDIVTASTGIRPRPSGFLCHASTRYMYTLRRIEPAI
ncbi:hypothetical protein FIE12Z_11420 [Fusarium flagelliforme]|uniref:Uncharacterized protein n=1 Tax=Fusarium flagelliforme TaxID=2675880 RepID=A0A395M929_9HYPO|nr:hypothetical protein FIE12Z_11420 [Fusarium flagelliforme]